MKGAIVFTAFLLTWSSTLWAVEVVKYPASWHSQFESPRYCELTTGSFGIDPVDRSIGTPVGFSLRFYHSVYSPGDYWWERLGYPAGETFTALNVTLLAGSRNAPLAIEDYLPLTVMINGIELTDSHEEFPHEMTVGLPETKALMVSLRQRNEFEIDITTGPGLSYKFQVQSLDFPVASAMFEACIDAMGS